MSWNRKASNISVNAISLYFHYVLNSLNGLSFVVRRKVDIHLFFIPKFIGNLWNPLKNCHFTSRMKHNSIGFYITLMCNELCPICYGINWIFFFTFFMSILRLSNYIIVVVFFFGHLKCIFVYVFCFLQNIFMFFFRTNKYHVRKESSLSN